MYFKDFRLLIIIMFLCVLVLVLTGIWSPASGLRTTNLTRLDCLLDNFWHQHVTEFTRFRENQTPSCLDWIITDDPEVLEELTYLEPLGNSDHAVMFH